MVNINLEPGKYVVAVSGGVDSMALLHLLTSTLHPPPSSFVVAHFDHGIRPDSAQDRKLVESAAGQYGLEFAYEEGGLGPSASEDTARKARYEFLHKVREKHGAKAIITAHHQDDLLETALLNMLRGTGRKGLSSLQSTDIIKRPLLHLSKQELLDYAKTHNIKWREDPTNQNTNYLRNYIRKHVVTKLTPVKRAELVKLLSNMKVQNQELDLQIANFLQFKEENKTELNKKLFISLPHDVASEVMAGWLRLNGIRDFDRKTIQRLVVSAKTLRPGQRSDINKTNYLYISKHNLVLSDSNQ